jgi:hypothetical protein
MVTYSPISRVIEQSPNVEAPQINLHSALDGSAPTQKLGTVTVYDGQKLEVGGDFWHWAVLPLAAPLPPAPPLLLVPPAPAIGVLEPPLPDSESSSGSVEPPHADHVARIGSGAAYRTM